MGFSGERVKEHFLRIVVLRHQQMIMCGPDIKVDWTMTVAQILDMGLLR